MAGWLQLLVSISPPPPSTHDHQTMHNINLVCICNYTVLVRFHNTAIVVHTKCTQFITIQLHKIKCTCSLSKCHLATIDEQLLYELAISQTSSKLI